MDTGRLIEAFVFYFVFLASTTFHEAAHAWAAMRGGDLTAYQGGQVTLDPRPHMRREPFGMVILPVISVILSGWPFGFASTPYNAQWALQHPRRSAWMALAGPLANLSLVIGSGIIILLGTLLGEFQAPDAISFGHIVAATGPGIAGSIALLLGVVFCLNLILFILNILPFPPLDGSGAILLLVPQDRIHDIQRRIFRARGMSFIGILIAWQVLNYVFWPALRMAVNLLYLGQAQYG